jgi:hypothetical protein
MLTSQRFALTLALCAAAACQPAEKLPNAYFAAPAGMAVAGTHFDHLFVANAGADALHVIALSQNMADIDLVPSPARYFPLEVPVGSNPSDVAATPDGRFVFVLDDIDSTLQVVDADTFRRARGADGQGLTAIVTIEDAGATAMVASPVPCVAAEADATTQCIGRAYVAARQASKVVPWDLREAADGSLSLVSGAPIAINGKPLRMAVDANAQALFVTDASSPNLLRVPLTSAGGSVTASVALGSFGGPVALSADGTMVVVGRPLTQDIVVLASNGASAVDGTLTIQDGNPALTPVPACLQSCADTNATACMGAHPADLGLCLQGSALVENANARYTGLYLGVLPAQMTAIGPRATGDLLAQSCAVPGSDAATSAHQQVMAVAALDGSVRLIGLRDATGAIDLQLLDSAFCQRPQVKPMAPIDWQLDTLLAACPAVPTDRKRFACISDDAKRPGVVSIMRGQANDQAWGVIWEGILANGDHSGGGGQILADGSFTDPGAELDSLGILSATAATATKPAERGDILEIVSAPRVQDAACSQSPYGGAKTCNLERRIAAVVAKTDGRPASLVLDRPLEPACFNGSVNYRLRAGDAFVVVPVDATGASQAPVARLPLGDTFGPGRVAFQSPAVAFQMRADLDPAADAAACSRYDLSAPGPHPSAALVRGKLYSWKVVDPFSPRQLGQRADALGNVQGPVGRLPGEMLMTAARPAAVAAGVPHFLAVSYTGSNAVMLMDPYTPTTFDNRDKTSRLLQLQH